MQKADLDPSAYLPTLSRIRVLEFVNNCEQFAANLFDGFSHRTVIHAASDHAALFVDLDI